MKDLYIVVDAETDGKIPGDHSLVSIGAVPVVRLHDAWTTANGEWFYRRVERRPNTVADRETMDWWHKQNILMYNEAFLEMPRSHPREAFQNFAAWATHLGETYHPDEVVLAASPIMFDGMWVRWYLEHYFGSCKPFSHRGLDIKSFYVGGRAGRAYADTHDNLYEFLAGKQPDDEKHHALRDAEYEARVFVEMLKLRDSKIEAE